MMDPVYSVQEAGWPSRISRAGDKDIHYFDFLIQVPAAHASEPAGYLGFVAYDTYEVRIFGDRYEVWFTNGTSPQETYSVAPGTTEGVHNIGIQASGITAQGAGAIDGVYIDGTLRLTFGVPFNSSGIAPLGRFGTHNPPGSDPGVDGIRLFDYFSYVKSFNRTLDDAPIVLLGEGGGTGSGTLDPDAPRVTSMFFDGSQPATTYELQPAAGTSTTGNPTGIGQPGVLSSGLPYEDVEGDASRVSFGRVDGFDGAGGNDASSRDTETRHVDGKRSTAIVIGNDLRIGGDSLPGVRYMNIVDATGTPMLFVRADAGLPAVPGTADGGQGGGKTMPAAAMYDAAPSTPQLGGSAGTEPPVPTAPSSAPFPSVASNESCSSEDAEADFLSDGGSCSCRGNDPSDPSAVVQVDVAINCACDYNGGDYRDCNPGVMMNAGGGKTTVYYAKEQFTEEYDDQGNVIAVYFTAFTSDGKQGTYKLKNIQKVKDPNSDEMLYDCNPENREYAGGGEDVLAALDEEERRLDEEERKAAEEATREPDIVGQIALTAGCIIFPPLGAAMTAKGIIEDAGRISEMTDRYGRKIGPIGGLFGAVGEHVSGASHWGAMIEGKDPVTGEPIGTVERILHGAGAVGRVTQSALGVAGVAGATNPSLPGRGMGGRTGAPPRTNPNVQKNFCFVAGTHVITEDGLKPIEEISVGDRVLARDETTGEQGFKKVLQTFVRQVERLTHLTYCTDDPETGIHTVVGTPDHPLVAFASKTRAK